MDSPQAPTPPDPVATANAQGAANVTAANQTAALNRPNQYTPYGSQTWAKTGGKTFDQSGYDSAMKAYNAGGTPGTPGTPSIPGTSGLSHGGNGGYGPEGEGGGETAYAGSGGTLGTPGTPGIPAGPAPDRNNFYSGSDDDARWSSTVTLDPRMQAIVDAQLATSQGLSGSTQSALGRVTDTLQNPIDYDKLPPAASFNPNYTPQTYGKNLGPLTYANQPYEKAPGALTYANQPQTKVPDAPEYAKQNYAGKTFDTGATYSDLAPNIAGVGMAANNATAIANKQFERVDALYAKDFNYDALGSMPQANAAVRQKVEDAYYNRERSRLDPRFTQDEDRLRTDLMNRGLTEGSQAWGAQSSNFGRNKNDAYALASDNAILKGGDEMQRLFGMEMSQRQQGVGEINRMREQPMMEAAAAAAAAGGMNSSLANLTNTETSQNAGKARDIALQEQLRIGSQQQEMAIHDQQQRLAGQNFDQRLRGQGQGHAQELQLQEQAFGQQFKSQSQNFDQSLRTQNQAYGQQSQSQSQDYAQQTARTDQEMRQEEQRASWADRSRSTALSEQERKRALVLNELASLRSGAQVAMPQFSSGASGATVGAAPVSQSAYNSYQGQVGQYNADVGSANSTMGALGGMAGAGFSGWAGSAAGSAALAALPFL